MLAPSLVDSRYRLSEDLAQELATEFQTPLYVVDEAHFRARIRAYRDAFASHWPNGGISYASKANPTPALIAIAYQEGCTIDVASEGELRAALFAGVPAEKCHLHGNNKQRNELEFAIAQGVGHIVVDHFGEIELLAELLGTNATTPQLVIRLAPGVDPKTNAKISTGQADTKFGFNIVDGAAERATTRMMELGLPLVGYHCHVGSQVLDPSAQTAGGELITTFAVEMKARHGLNVTYLNVGGGLGVRYTDPDVPMAISEFNRLIVDSVRRALAGSGIEPYLGQEPGRSLIAESGVTLYQVGVVKTVPAKEIGQRTYVCVDGGLSDNPRPVMYGSKYTVERVSPSEAGETRTVTVSGKHCETDKLFEGIELPADVKAGDLIQVLCTGAYNAAMSSNYNRYRRPEMVLIRESGEVVTIQRRDTWEDLLARDHVPSDLVSQG